MRTIRKMLDVLQMKPREARLRWFGCEQRGGGVKEQKDAEVWSWHSGRAKREISGRSEKRT